MKLVRTRLAYCPCVMILLAAASPFQLLGQYQKYEGMVVRNISFDPREQPLEPSELHDILPLKMGEPLKAATVRATIERLFATGRYADIEVDAQAYLDGVAITFRTKNSWFVGGVSVTGNISSPPNKGQLENAADLDLGKPYTESSLERGVANQKRLMENNGLFHGVSRPILDWETNREFQQVNIGFDVDRGRRAIFGMPIFTGDLKMDQERLLRATRFRRWLIHTWKPMTQARVRQGLDGVRRLYEKQNRLEARVSLESMRYDDATNRAIATMHIDAGPRIDVNVIGAKVAQSKLQRYVPIYEEHAVDHDLLMEGERNLREYFQSDGYFDAEVQFKEQTVMNDKATIDYLVNRGKKHRLVYIGITGNSYFTTEAIRERMYLRKETWLQFPHGRYSAALLRRDKENITSLYQSNGFRDVEVTSREVDDYLGKPGDMAVFIDIKEGPQYFIESLQVTGIERLNSKVVLSSLSSIKGQPFSEFNVAVDRDAILAQYFEKGFPSATFEWNSKPSAMPYRVDLTYVIHEGDQQFVRQVIITGNRHTKQRLIDRTITLNPGDPLSPTAMTDIQRRLYNLGVFARVDTAVQNPDGEEPRKYVLYNLDEARRYSLAVGFGAELGRIGGCQTCLEAPAGTTGFSPRVSFDITRSNLWGLTHSVSLRTRVSAFDQRGVITYTWPHFRDSDKLILTFNLLFENSRDIRTFNFTRAEGAAQLAQRVSKAITLFYRFAYRRVTVYDLKVTPFLIPQLSQPVRVGIASFNMVQDHRDDPLDPHRGYFNTLDLGVADHIFGSQRNFVRLLARNATYHPIGKRLVLARSLQFGDIYSFAFAGSSEDAIPLPERFFGGGSNSNRGFPEYQAGPRDLSTGFPLGGTALLFNQTELRFPLIGENVGGVLFHDAGNIYAGIRQVNIKFNQLNVQDFDYMVQAVGFGIRYRTPIGPVRVDLAYSLNPPSFIGFSGTQQQLVNAGVNPCSPPPGVPNQCVLQHISHFQFFFSIGQTF
jgi:outer membrane protein insertion porin family